MTAPVANCPSCGSPIAFQWAGAVQTVCGTCKSILVRHDVDLEKVGVVSEPPPVTSRIRLGSTGTYRGRRFNVVGRIAYRYERGSWSEWHLGFGDGRSGWLSDAQDECAVSFAAPEAVDLPPDAAALTPGDRLTAGGLEYRVGSINRAHYAGTEGELPFAEWDGADSVFADLRGEGGRFATIDYSDGEPRLFAGEVVSWDSLALKELAEPQAPRVEGARTLNCPNCGGTVSLRLPGESVNAVCEYCQTVLQVETSGGLKELQRFNDKIKLVPLIPLGSVGRLHGAEYTVLGFQQRTIQVEGVRYSWREYLLHAPGAGFRYLTEYDGHWNDVAVVNDAPRVTRSARNTAISFRGKQFRHFQRAQAETTYVLGEFPWQVRVDDKTQNDDYVAPPLLLSREVTKSEETWSLGEYTPGGRIWEAFKLPGRAPSPRGTFANQPSPHPTASGITRTFAVLATIVFVAWIFRMSGSRDVVAADGKHAGSPGGNFGMAAPAADSFGVFNVPGSGNSASAGSSSVQPSTSTGTDSAGGDFGATSTASDTADGGGAVLITDPFQVTGRTSNLDVRLDTDVSNSWGAFTVTLVREPGGEARQFDSEVGYYYGVDGGERWSEGSRNARLRIPDVPQGLYRLAVAADGPGAFEYKVRVRRDVPSTLLYVLAFLALLVPAAIRWIQAHSFERSRWAESDYPPASLSDLEE